MLVALKTGGFAYIRVNAVEAPMPADVASGVVASELQRLTDTQTSLTTLLDAAVESVAAIKATPISAPAQLG